MANTTSIPTGLNIPSQIPLDTVRYVLNESTLSNLGTDNYLAFIYFKNLIIHCFEENSNWIWREVQAGEENTGLLSVDYQYPFEHEANNINYSNKKYNFFKVEYIELENLNENINISNIGNGHSLYKAFNTLTNNHEFKKIISNNLSINSTGDQLEINTPSTASIPALYVNDLYIPTYNDWLTENSFQNGGTPIAGFVFRGKGTLAQPFTNSTVYTLNTPSPTPTSITPNTAIQNALDGDSAYSTTYSYVGKTSLGFNRLNPQRRGQTIIVQNNNSSYGHAGDYSYMDIKINFQANVVNTTSGYIVDMDNPTYFDADNSYFTIIIDEGYVFQCTDSLGFRNSGNTSILPPSFDTGRIGFIEGEGTLYFSYNGSDILNRYIFTGEGNNNDDNLHFQVKCIVRADQQGIYLTKNKMRIDFYNLLQSGVFLGSGNVNLQAFRMTGGQVRFYEKGSVSLQNGTTGRIYGFTFEPEGIGIGYTIFKLNSAQVTGTSLNCFAKLNNERVEFLAFNSPSGDDFATTLLGVNAVVNGLFENLGEDKWSINFKNNVFSYTGIDQTKVDLTGGNTYSAVNFIGNEILENLVVFESKAQALSAGHPIGLAFIKRNVFNAVDLVAGVEYKVVTSGSPSLGTVGSFFTATGSETGTGTASLETREIL